MNGNKNEKKIRIYFKTNLTHSVLNSGEPTFPIELNRKQKHFQRNAIIVENYYCIANTSVTTKLHVLKICKLWFSFLIL